MRHRLLFPVAVAAVLAGFATTADAKIQRYELGSGDAGFPYIVYTPPA